MPQNKHLNSETIRNKIENAHNKKKILCRLMFISYFCILIEKPLYFTKKKLLNFN